MFWQIHCAHAIWSLCAGTELSVSSSHWCVTAPSIALTARMRMRRTPAAVSSPVCICTGVMICLNNQCSHHVLCTEQSVLHSLYEMLYLCRINQNWFVCMSLYQRHILNLRRSVMPTISSAPTACVWVWTGSVTAWMTVVTTQMRQTVVSAMLIISHRYCSYVRKCVCVSVCDLALSSEFYLSRISHRGARLLTVLPVWV